MLGAVGWAVVAVGVLVALRAVLWERLCVVAVALRVGPLIPVVVVQLALAAATGLAADAFDPAARRQLERHT